MTQKNDILYEEKNASPVAKKYIDSFLRRYSNNWLSAVEQLKELTNMQVQMPEGAAEEMLMDTIENINLKTLQQSEKPGIHNSALMEIFSAFKNTFIQGIITLMMKTFDQNFINNFTRKIITKAFVLFDEPQREIFVFLYVDGFKTHQICGLVHESKPDVIKRLYTCRITIAKSLHKKPVDDKLSERNYSLFISYFENVLTPEEETKFLSKIAGSDSLKKEFNVELQLRYFLDKQKLLDFYSENSNLPSAESIKAITKNFEIIYKPLQSAEKFKLFSAEQIKMARKIAGKPSISHKELAEELNISINTIDTNLKRFLDKVNNSFMTDFTSPKEAAIYLIQITT